MSATDTNRKERIFLCDDDELIVAMLARALKKDGYEVKVKMDSDNALSEIAAWQPDVVLLDIQLDEHKSGLEILKEIRDERIDTRVIMITGDDRAESVYTAWQFGATRYLTKPFDVDELRSAIRAAAQHRDTPGGWGEEGPLSAPSA